jgi:pyrimidine precursor biosynthesis enzyme
MDIAAAIISGKVDGGIGIESVQSVELEQVRLCSPFPPPLLLSLLSSVCPLTNEPPFPQWCTSVGRSTDDVQMIRIDELAELGCCCFCSILSIVNDEFLAKNPEKVAAFVRLSFSPLHRC